MKVYLATWLEDSQGQGLTRVGNVNRLLSYFFVMDKGRNLLRKYARRGEISVRRDDENKKERIT